MDAYDEVQRLFHGGHVDEAEAVAVRACATDWLLEMALEAKQAALLVRWLDQHGRQKFDFYMHVPPSLGVLRVLIDRGLVGPDRLLDWQCRAPTRAHFDLLGAALARHTEFTVAEIWLVKCDWHCVRWLVEAYPAAMARAAARIELYDERGAFNELELVCIIRDGRLSGEHLPADIRRVMAEVAAELALPADERPDYTWLPRADRLWRIACGLVTDGESDTQHRRIGLLYNPQAYRESTTKDDIPFLLKHGALWVLDKYGSFDPLDAVSICLPAEDGVLRQLYKACYQRGKVLRFGQSNWNLLCAVQTYTRVCAPRAQFKDIRLAHCAPGMLLRVLVALAAAPGLRFVHLPPKVAHDTDCEALLDQVAANALEMPRMPRRTLRALLLVRQRGAGAPAARSLARMSDVLFGLLLAAARRAHLYALVRSPPRTW